ncbi:MAG TPA: hypothetical protein VF296_02240 [Gallionella sp.]
MQKIRYVFILLGVLLCPVASAAVQVSIGINLPAYPAFVVVPGYPVYYAPRLQANLFFYDGMYWVYQDDNWYESTWYNGPWWLVDPEVVPLFVLRIPVRYYRLPPAYFFGWRSDAPPRWGDHWGSDWEQRRSGWDRWNRSAAPAPAPLPAYQRQYSGDRYPRQVEQQQEIQKQNYRYQPRDPVVRQQYREQAVQRAPVQQGRPQQEIQRAPAQQVRPQQEIQVAPRSQSPQRGGENVQRPIPVSPQQVRPEVQDRRQQPQPAPDQRGQQRPIPVSPQQVRPEVQDRRQPPQSAPDQREQQMPGSQGREERQQDNTRGPKQGQEQGRGRDRNE